MKLVTFSHLHRTAPDRVEGQDTHVGIYLPGDVPRILNLEAAHVWLNKKRGGISPHHPPMTMLQLLDGGADAMDRVRNLAEIVCADDAGLWECSQPLDDVQLLAPIPFPRTIRDFYAFEQHVKTARALRGLDMIPEWYDHPVFYYSNPGAVYGPDEEVPYPRGSREVDYELEIACVIGKPGRDIDAEEANEYIAGYMVMNDWSARDTWRNFESKLSMGPAKSKDFANSLGPWLVTPDELEDVRQGDGKDTRYNLGMSARVNGRELSRGNANTLTHTFASMIEWASTDVWLRPGDVLGSGTVGTGCILELRPENTGGWLKPGDVVELEIERLGVLRNRLVGQE
ncbi:MAG: fumarylacetoacetate hydrolase family protein [Chloroflexota bacterium]|nr:fumarylacetoacetate hydrolase family protein [Chloroflexota bacterium]MDQ5867439.1 fumarylacetoacetate hydrolase family protein [Chloroflexota bacterium]